MSESRGKEGERREETVAVHRADSWAEAMVIRSLLESAGIDSPPLTRTDPYPLGNPPAEFPGAEILVRESQVEEARRIIADYLSSPPAQQPENNENNENNEPESSEPKKSQPSA